MTKQCPNCSKEFIEIRETAFRCEDCGWFKNVDGHWHHCPEPSKPADPVPPKAKPKPSKVVAAADYDPEPDSVDVQVKNYLGGLVTVTTIKDDQNEEKVD